MEIPYIVAIETLNLTTGKKLTRYEVWTTTEIDQLNFISEKLKINDIRYHQFGYNYQVKGMRAILPSKNFPLPKETYPVKDSIVSLALLGLWK